MQDVNPCLTRSATCMTGTPPQHKNGWLSRCLWMQKPSGLDFSEDYNQRACFSVCVPRVPFAFCCVSLPLLLTGRPLGGIQHTLRPLVNLRTIVVLPFAMELLVAENKPPGIDKHGVWKSRVISEDVLWYHHMMIQPICFLPHTATVCRKVNRTSSHGLGKQSTSLCPNVYFS